MTPEDMLTRGEKSPARLREALAILLEENHAKTRALAALEEVEQGREGLVQLFEDTAKERDQARADARVLAHAYERDTRPPPDVVSRGLSYPVKP